MYRDLLLQLFVVILILLSENLAAETPAHSTECGEQAEEHLLQSAHLSMSFI